MREENGFLLFEIDYRPFLKSDRRNIYLEKQLQQAVFLKMEKKKLTDDIYSKLDWQMLYEKANILCSPILCYEEAQEADRIVKDYLETIFGDLIFKKEIETSDIILCCNTLGISREIFDSVVSYKEKKNHKIKLLPVI